METKLINWDRESFRNYLIKNKKLSARVASDNVSRCNRVERDLDLDLMKFIKTVDSYKELLIKIERYSEEVATDGKAVSGLAGTLRKATRYFLEYKVGSNNALRYPLAYNLGKRYTKHPDNF